LPLEDVVDVAQPGFLHQLERGLELDALRHEKTGVEAIQVLLGCLLVSPDGVLGSFGVVCEEDGRDAGQKIVFKIVGFQLPLRQHHCGCVIPAQREIKMKYCYFIISVHTFMSFNNVEPVKLENFKLLYSCTTVYILKGDVFVLLY
jgi:hypothetical protein